MSSSNCCFLTCIQISQEAGQVVWYFHLFQNFPQFIVVRTVKGFGIVNKAETDVFLELSCFFADPADVGNLISGSSAFSKTSMNIRKFTVHVLLKPGLQNLSITFWAILDRVLKSKGITLPTKVHIIQAMVFLGVMYSCESWSITKAEHWTIDTFELWCWRRLLRVLWTARRSNQSIVKETSPGCSLEGLMLMLKLQNFAHLMRKNWFIWKDPDAGKDWGQEKKGVTEDEMVGWHHWLDGHEFEQAVEVGDGQGSLACCSPWSQNVGHDWTTKLNWTDPTSCKRDNKNMLTNWVSNMWRNNE